MRRFWRLKANFTIFSSKVNCSYRYSVVFVSNMPLDSQMTPCSSTLWTSTGNTPRDIPAFPRVHSFRVHRPLSPCPGWRYGPAQAGRGTGVRQTRAGRGCGAGARDVYLLHTWGYDVYGIDAVEDNISLGKGLHPQIADRLRVADMREPLDLRRVSLISFCATP